MDYENLVYPMRITVLSQNEYFVDYPCEGIRISASADSLNEALELAKSTLEFTLCNMYENNEPFPSVEVESLLKLEKEKKENELITFIATSLNNIIRQYGDKPVKLTVSIPEYQKFWLNSQNISLSKFLQEHIDRAIRTGNR